MDDPRLNDWVMVISSSPPSEGASSEAQRRAARISNVQLDAAMSLKPALKGVEDCSKPDANAPLCATVDAYPSFCNASTRVCVSGLRPTAESFRALADLT